MRKYKKGDRVVKAYMESWDGGKGVRTVYIDEQGNLVVKLNGFICKLSEFNGKAEIY